MADDLDFDAVEQLLDNAETVRAKSPPRDERTNGPNIKKCGLEVASFDVNSS